MRIRIADGTPQRIGDMGQQHMPGEDVRSGRKSEPAFMALDGRRRRMGLLLLKACDEIDDDYIVECLVSETPAQQAAATVLPNTEHAPVTIEDARFALVGMDRYLAAGGRVSSDLFGEYPDFLLDPDILHTAWRARVQPLVDHLKGQDLAVFVGADGGFGAPDGFDRLPYLYVRDLSDEKRASLVAARDRVAQLCNDLQDLKLEADETPAALGPLLMAMALEAGGGAHLRQDRRRAALPCGRRRRRIHLALLPFLTPKLAV